MTRAFLKSNVEKNVNKSTVVILDSLNYIKGIAHHLMTINDFFNQDTDMNYSAWQDLLKHLTVWSIWIFQEKLQELIVKIMKVVFMMNCKILMSNII